MISKNDQTRCLESLLNSQEFSGSKIYNSYLNYLVEAKNAGRSLVLERLRQPTCHGAFLDDSNLPAAARQLKARCQAGDSTAKEDNLFVRF